MTETGRRTRITEKAPWLVCLVLLGLLTLVLVRSRSTEMDNFDTLVKQREAIAGMRTSLFESIHAEKSALLAESENESKAFADQARAVSEAFNRGRRELDPLVGRLGAAREKELVIELDSFWKEFQEIQRTILDLDIEGTNIKALALSSTKGQPLVTQFEASMEKLRQATGSTERCGEVSKLASDALIALMKIEVLHNPHIHAVADEEMDRIEKSMREQDAIVQNALASIGEIAGQSSRDEIDRATQIYVDFAAVTDEVIKLSRTNTNVRSLELAMGRERLVAAKCNEILASLQEALGERGGKATR
ncbi:MAG: hypothetical protein AB9873_10500 [Syntrophobacteraceae bacterium]